ncbi:hypothetical protein [Paracoccus litorisediminis]|nr:hypothetical protein [Paracoccus litorisediminis]
MNHTFIGFADPPSFPVTCPTTDDRIKWITLIGQATNVPDLWEAQIPGVKNAAFVMKGSGAIIHDAFDTQSLIIPRALHWDALDYLCRMHVEGVWV